MTISYKYEVGDKVKIRSLEWYNQNKDNVGCIDSFVPPMVKYCGKEATIEESFYGTYLLDIDNRSWYWTDKMFESDKIELV